MASYKVHLALNYKETEIWPHLTSEISKGAWRGNEIHNKIDEIWNLRLSRFAEVVGL